MSTRKFITIVALTSVLSWGIAESLKDKLPQPPKKQKFFAAFRSQNRELSEAAVTAEEFRLEPAGMSMCVVFLDQGRAVAAVCDVVAVGEVKE